MSVPPLAAQALIGALNSKKFANTAKSLMSATSSLNDAANSGALQSLENSFGNLTQARLGLVPFENAMKLMGADTTASSLELMKANFELLENPTVQDGLSKMSQFLNDVIDQGTDFSNNVDDMITNLTSLSNTLKNGAADADAADTKAQAFFAGLYNSMLPLGNVNFLLNIFNDLLARLITLLQNPAVAEFLDKVQNWLEKNKNNIRDFNVSGW